MDLACCRALGGLPDQLLPDGIDGDGGGVTALRTLDLGGLPWLRSLPPSIRGLSRLQAAAA